MEEVLKMNYPRNKVVLKQYTWWNEKVLKKNRHFRSLFTKGNITYSYRIYDGVVRKLHQDGETAIISFFLKVDVGSFGNGRFIYLYIYIYIYIQCVWLIMSRKFASCPEPPTRLAPSLAFAVRPVFIQ